MIVYTGSRRIVPYRDAINALYLQHELQVQNEVNIYVFLVSSNRQNDIYVNPRFAAALEVLLPAFTPRWEEINVPFSLNYRENLNTRRECWIGLRAIGRQNPHRNEILHLYATVVATFDYYLNGQLTV